MLFVEVRYLAFFGVFLCLYWALRETRSRLLLIVAGSYMFYASWDWRFLGLILLSTAVDYVSALRIQDSENRTVRRAWLIFSLAANLGMLGFFKYFNFFAAELNALVGALGGSLDYTTLNIILPVGISFYTLQTMSYTLDVYTKRSTAHRDPLIIAAFVAFFPQLVAGPILRAHNFVPQLETNRRWADVPVQACLLLFLIGFFKKTVVADNLSFLVDPIYADPSGYTYLSVLGGIVGFSIQLYCDFSGYSDIAIASAGLLGFRLGRNFYMPHLATSPTEWRRRWHISLTEWLKDYMYIPLGGSRRGRTIAYRNVFLTNVVSGIWHGAAWTFFAWGVASGTAVILHRLWHNAMAKRSIHIPLRWLFGWMIMIYVLVFSLSLFRAEDLSVSWSMFSILHGIAPAGLAASPLNPLWIAFAFWALQWSFHKSELQMKVEDISPVLFAMFLAGGVVACFALRAAVIQDFYYFQF